MMTRRITTALAALALVGAMGACGGSGDDDDTEDPVAGEDPGGEGDSEEAADAILEYAQCMRDHGLDYPDPEINAEGEAGLSLPDPEEAGVTEEELRTAVEECETILDEAQQNREPVDPDVLAERQDQVLVLAKCMRDRGWDMPDPVVEEGGGIAIQNPSDVGGPGDPNFESFQNDMEDCQEEAGMEPPGEGDGEGTVHEETGP